MQVDEAALMNMVALLQLPIPLSKHSLARVYSNLCLHPLTCSQLLSALFGLLRSPVRSPSGDAQPPQRATSSQACSDCVSPVCVSS